MAEVLKNSSYKLRVFKYRTQNTEIRKKENLNKASKALSEDISKHPLHEIIYPG